MALDINVFLKIPRFSIMVIPDLKKLNYPIVMLPQWYWSCIADYTNDNTMLYQSITSFIIFHNIPRISNVTLIDWHKTIITLFWCWHNYTGLLSLMILMVLIIPDSTNQYQFQHFLNILRISIVTIPNWHKTIIPYCDDTIIILYWSCFADDTWGIDNTKLYQSIPSFNIFSISRESALWQYLTDIKL